MRCLDLERIHISAPCHHSTKDSSSDSSVDSLHSTYFRGVQIALESIPGITELYTARFLGFAFHGKYCIALSKKKSYNSQKVVGNYYVTTLNSDTKLTQFSSKDLAQICQSPHFKNSMKISGISLISNIHCNILKLSIKEEGFGGPVKHRNYERDCRKKLTQVVMG